MRFTIISSILVIVSGSTTTRDPCTSLCMAFNDPINPLCGNPISTCINNMYCLNLVWTEVGSEMIWATLPQAQEHLDKPVGCRQARQFVDALEGRPLVFNQHIYIPIQGIRGIANLGNTCYVSSAIQILAHITPLRNVIRRVDDIPLTNYANVQFVNLIADVIDQIWSGTSITPINIGPIITALEIDPNQMGDVHEVLGRIFGYLQAGGVGIDEPASQFSGMMVNLEQGMNNLSLYQAMASFFGVEFNEDGPSEVLMVNFQRVNQETGDRINTNIDFPLEMNLADMPGNGHGRYRLVGIIDHTGSHYLAQVAIDGHWVVMDDDLCVYKGNQPQTTQSRLVTSLVYERIPEQAEEESNQ